MIGKFIFWTGQTIVRSAVRAAEIALMAGLMTIFYEIGLEEGIEIKEQEENKKWKSVFAR